MDKDNKLKPFLDTSVARPVLVGTSLYRQHLKDCFGDSSLYVSPFIQMEFTRGFICHLLDFYFLLDIPTIETIGDAFTLWSDRFSSRELKSVLQMISQLIDARGLSFSDPKDKEKGLKAVSQIVERLVIKWNNTFKLVGQNSTRCQRALLSLKIGKVLSNRENFRDFLTTFNDLKSCSKQCKAYQFLFADNAQNVKALVKHASTFSNRTSAENSGFIRIAKKLERILQKGQDISCKECGSLGDAIIALDGPPGMRLEHTDYSFDHLCNLIGYPHQRHPSQMAFLPNTAKM